jgi:DNA-binding NtrC family response regulator
MSTDSRPKGRLLVVEDEAYVRESLGALLRGRGYDVTLADGVENAMQALKRGPVDLLLTDLNMPGGGGLEVVKRSRALSPETPVVVLTGFGTVASAVECLRAGATDYILKPADPDALEVAFARAMRQRSLEMEVSYLRGATGGEENLPIGESSAWQKVVQMVRAAAPTDSTVLLMGESGTGKELLARLVHRLSRRAAGPFIEVNCAAVPVEVWESEFFGHRRGSFTGAVADRHGRFRLADKGTLFIDEIGAMPHEAQAKLLRAIQEGEFHRLGDEQATRVDVRIVAATNSKLEEDMAAGRFRQDLYYRLNVLRIDVPPLRDRPSDVPLLGHHFVSEISQRLGRKPLPIPDGTLAEMQAYHWPGNVRELRSVIERSMILDPDGGLGSLDLSPVRGEAHMAPLSEVGDDLTLRKALGRTEKAMVIEALRRAGSVRKEAARLLGIDQRNMGYYLRKHGIDPDKPGPAGEED